METVLNEEQVRVVGALIEKELTTPDYYPLTLNALTSACNQKSNREPVVAYDEKTVIRALDALRAKGYAQLISSVGSRVYKYRQILTEKLELTPPEVAALGVIFLRGPQTVGEIRGRTGRMYQFSGLEEVERTLEGLLEREGGPMVMKLPRQSGRKDHRFMHLFAGEPEVPEEEDVERPEAARVAVQREDERIAVLESEVQRLREELTVLHKQFQDFKQQFE